MSSVPNSLIRRLTGRECIDLINRVINVMSEKADARMLTINQKIDEWKNDKSNTYSKNQYDDTFDKIIPLKTLIDTHKEDLNECLANIERINEKYKMLQRGMEEFIQLNNSAYLESNTLQDIAGQTIKKRKIIPTRPEEIMALRPEQVYPTGGKIYKKTTRKTRRKKRKSNK